MGILVIFTILSQAAIGLVTMLAVGNIIFKVSEVQPQKISKALLVALLLAAISMAAAGLHLGSPLRGIYAMLHLSSSWLSREIFLSGLFFIVTLICFLFAQKGKNINTLLVVASLIGLATVFAQAATYTNTVFPAWGIGHPYVTFYGATIALGAFLGAVLLLGGKADLELAGAAKYSSVLLSLATLAIIIPAGFYGVFAGALGDAGIAGLQSLLLLKEYSGVILGGWIMAAIALIGFGCLVRKQASGNKMIVLLALVVVAEVINRFIFFSIGVPICW